MVRLLGTLVLMTVATVVLGELQFVKIDGSPHSESDGNCFPNFCPNYPPPIPLPNLAKMPQMKKALDDVDDFLSNQTNPSYIIVIVYQDEIIWSKGYGKQNPFDPNSAPPTIDSVVRIASITKTFTALMLAQLRDQGIVDLDDPVEKYLPEFSIKNPFVTAHPITLFELCSHTSGLPRELPYCNVNVSLCTQNQILSLLSQQYLIYPQFERPHYSNLGISLLGHALESAVGIPYTQYIEDNILAPLNMTSTTFDISQVADRMAIGVLELPNGTAVPAPFSEGMGWQQPAGGLFASARDMAKYISFMMRKNALYDPESGQPLDASTVAEFVMQVVLMTPDGQWGFGLPWEHYYDPTTMFYYRNKAGELPGYSTWVAVVPEIQLGLFVARQQSPTPQSLKNNGCYAFPVLQMVIPALVDILLQEQAENEGNMSSIADLYVGSYTSANLFMPNSTAQIVFDPRRPDALQWYAGSSNQPSLLLYPQPTLGNGLNVLMAQMAKDNIQCRWMDDGPEGELMYFTFNAEGTMALTIEFMGSLYVRVDND